MQGLQGTNCLIVSGNSSDYTNDRLCLEGRTGSSLRRMSG